MNIALSVVLIASLAATPVLAQSSTEEPEGRRLAGVLFDTIDADGDGSASYAEMLGFTDQVIAASDVDEDGSVSYDEFATWDFGMQNLASREGREQALGATLALVFDLWDRDNDDAIARAEFERGVVAGADYADLDGDRSLTREEFLDGFITNIAFRSGLRTDR